MVSITKKFQKKSKSETAISVLETVALLSALQTVIDAAWKKMDSLRGIKSDGGLRIRKSIGLAFMIYPLFRTRK